MSTFDPYSPPARAVTPPVPVAVSPGLDTARLHAERFLIALNGLLVTTAVLAAVSVADRFGVLAGLPRAARGPAELAYLLLTMTQILLWIFCAVYFLLWLYRAVENVRQLGGGFSRDTPVWSVVWWFVPILNLWRPYQVMADLWRRSVSGNALDAEPVRTPGWLLGWWLLWLVAGRFDPRAGQVAESPDPTGTVVAFVVLCGLHIVAGLMVAKLVRTIDEAQIAAASGLQVETVLTGAPAPAA